MVTTKINLALIILQTTANSSGGEKISWVKSRLGFQEMLNPDLQDFPNFCCQGMYISMGIQKLDIFYINVGKPSVVNTNNDKRKSERRFYSSGLRSRYIDLV